MPSEKFRHEKENHLIVIGEAVHGLLLSYDNQCNFALSQQLRRRRHTMIPLAAGSDDLLSAVAAVASQQSRRINNDVKR